KEICHAKATASYLETEHEALSTAQLADTTPTSLEQRDSATPTMPAKKGAQYRQSKDNPRDYAHTSDPLRGRFLVISHSTSRIVKRNMGATQYRWDEGRRSNSALVLFEPIATALAER